MVFLRGRLTVGICLGTYDGPKRRAVAYERGTPVPRIPEMTRLLARGGPFPGPRPHSLVLTAGGDCICSSGLTHVRSRVDTRQVLKSWMW